MQTPMNYRQFLDKEFEEFWFAHSAYWNRKQVGLLHENACNLKGKMGVFAFCALRMFWIEKEVIECRIQLILLLKL